ncbi:MAG: hypothetical protein IRY98_11050, partial [Alicyclobacillaceae bacterium]|nr:hypothetical protein [Alicyclobacillaceae bacterium]
MRKRTLFLQAVAGTLLVTLGAAAASPVWAQDSTSGTAADNGVSVTVTPASGSGTASDPAARAPRILPDNLAYFLKIALERIRLALTQNDTQKARLLTEFAEERLSEAFALIREGKTDLAEKTLEEALQDQRLALDLTSGEKTGEKDQTSAKPADNGTPEDTAHSGDLQGGTGTAPDSASGKPADPDTWKRAAHNVEALSAALQKVGSSRAQDAIQQNILRDLEHLKKKLDHWLNASGAPPQEKPENHEDGKTRKDDGEKGDTAQASSQQPASPSSAAQQNAGTSPSR